jgi:hypothetical protein
MREAQQAGFFDPEYMYMFLSPFFAADFKEFHLAVACVVNATGFIDGGLYTVYM